MSNGKKISRKTIWNSALPRPFFTSERLSPLMLEMKISITNDNEIENEIDNKIENENEH